MNQGCCMKQMKWFFEWRVLCNRDWRSSLLSTVPQSSMCSRVHIRTHLLTFDLRNLEPFFQFLSYAVQVWLIKGTLIFCGRFFLCFLTRGESNLSCQDIIQTSNHMTTLSHLLTFWSFEFILNIIISKWTKCVTNKSNSKASQTEGIAYHHKQKR